MMNTEFEHCTVSPLELVTRPSSKTGTRKWAPEAPLRTRNGMPGQPTLQENIQNSDVRLLNLHTTFNAQFSAVNYVFHAVRRCGGAAVPGTLHTSSSSTTENGDCFNASVSAPPCPYPT